VWCLDCRRQVELDPINMAERYGAATPVPEWRRRLACSQCGSRRVNMVVDGGRRSQGFGMAETQSFSRIGCTPETGASRSTMMTVRVRSRSFLADARERAVRYADREYGKFEKISLAPYP
jgi:DNA-directed RNA polymerase subunit RPC12/RpoP